MNSESVYRYRALIIFACFALTGLYLLIMRLLLLRRIRLKTLKEAVDEVKPKRKPSFRQAPIDTTGKTLIGYKSGSIPVYTSDSAKHIFVCGTTGSGKTVALSNYIKSAIDKDYPLLLIDGKGDTNSGSMLDIVNRLRGNKKLYVINMVDISHSDKYNPFMGANPTTVKDMLINMSEWTEQHYKANTERYIERLVRLLALGSINLSFKNILAYMPANAFQVLSAKLNKDGLLSKEEHLSNLELIKTSGAIANSACARFSLIQGKRDMLLKIPPKMSVSGAIGYLKGKSTLLIFDRHADMKYKYGQRQFWCRGYFVDTVGKNTKAIKSYIENQLREDKLNEDMSTKEYIDPFTGKKHK